MIDECSMTNADRGEVAAASDECPDWSPEGLPRRVDVRVDSDAPSLSCAENEHNYAPTSFSAWT